MDSQVSPYSRPVLPDNDLSRTDSPPARSAVRPTLDPARLSYRLLRPSEAGVADVALLGEAYRCWSSVWSSTLRELDGIDNLPSDEFTRQDEVGAIFHDCECIALSCFRWIDLSTPMTHHDSYFRIWPDEARAGAAREGTRICIGSHVTVDPAWRRVRGGSLRHIITALAIDRAQLADSATILGTMRDDRGMAGLVAALGATTLGHAQLHGVPVTLIAVYGSSRRQPLDARNESILQGLRSSIGAAPCSEAHH